MPTKKPTSSFNKNKSLRFGAEEEATAATVSDRATESPNELIAETFAALLAGKPVSKEARALVRKYQGVFP